MESEIKSNSSPKRKLTLVEKGVQEWPPGWPGRLDTYQPERLCVPEKQHLQRKETKISIQSTRMAWSLSCFNSKALYCFLFGDSDFVTIFSILLQKCRQYCLLGIQCKKGWHNAQIERSYSNVAIYPDSSWAGVLVDATNRVGCYYVVNIAAKTGKTWYVEISNNIR